MPSYLKEEGMRAKFVRETVFAKALPPKGGLGENLLKEKSG
jgi:hypothetical protein